MAFQPFKRHEVGAGGQLTSAGATLSTFQASPRGNKLSTPDAVFREARDKFLKALSKEEKAQFTKCDSIDKLLADVKKPLEFSRSHRRVSACLRIVKSFGDNLEPYFKIVELVCGAHPEFANIAFGAFRLVLVVSF